jgi:hypothetical protein
MFGLMIPMQFYIYAACAVLAIGGLGYGKYESAKYDAYKSKVELAAQQQEFEIKSRAKQANLINEKVKNDYENRLDIIKRTYGGMRLASTNQTGTVSPAPSRTDGTATDPQFIAKCAMTTQQLESLQAWLNEQIGVFNAK